MTQGERQWRISPKEANFALIYTHASPLLSFTSSLKESLTQNVGFKCWIPDKGLDFAFPCTISNWRHLCNMVEKCYQIKMVQNNGETGPWIGTFFPSSYCEFISHYSREEIAMTEARPRGVMTSHSNFPPQQLCLWTSVLIWCNAALLLLVPQNSLCLNLNFDPHTPSIRFKL